MLTRYPTRMPMVLIHPLLKNVHPWRPSFNDTAKLKIRNTGHSTVCYQITNNTSVAIQPYNGKNGYIFGEPVTYIDNAEPSIYFSQKTIKLAPRKSATIKVTLTSPNTNPHDHTMYDGYIQFNNKSQTTSIAPYSILALSMNSTNYPSLCLDPLW
ncbi:predicted protein [Lichtheimia corymbifera JMRC:FSU:9682]|uniref:C5a peptidase/Subtilisin-like protease SBT2-like Fn3-like domain-containing protein n=1 Tax=Lichtheimia corymbifera JMRC:FSU:9682 TaxID=1263082 RepID=A0A068RSX5_9FUNG|nr:predicted protein [Lichtheimia corymbifera JMRC:FSU:9682]